MGSKDLLSSAKGGFVVKNGELCKLMVDTGGNALRDVNHEKARNLCWRAMTK
jgi:hypothetical protein